MMDRGWGRVVKITSQSVRAPIGVSGGSSNSARNRGLTGLCRGYLASGRGQGCHDQQPGCRAFTPPDPAPRMALDGGVRVKQKWHHGWKRPATGAAHQQFPQGVTDHSRHESGRLAAFLCSRTRLYLWAETFCSTGGATKHDDCKLWVANAAAPMG